MEDTADKPVPVLLHEESPLMTAARTGDASGLRPVVVDEPSKSVWYLVLLTLSIGG